MTDRHQLRSYGRGSSVSSQAHPTETGRRIEPLAFGVPVSSALRAVLTVLTRIPRTQILERDELSVHAIVRSPVLRIPLDVEFMLVAGVGDAPGLVHLRASTPVAVRERATSRVRARQLLALVERELRISA